MGPVPRFDHEMLLGIIDCPCNGEDPGCEHEGESVEDLTWALTLCRNLAIVGALCESFTLGAEFRDSLGNFWSPNTDGLGAFDKVDVCRDCGQQKINGKFETAATMPCDMCGAPCGWCGGEGGLDGRPCQVCDAERDPYDLDGCGGGYP